METNHITDAEWQIMREIWSVTPATSGSITEVLSKSSGWSPTTVKTLLSRLVKKKVIDFEEKGRTFYYYPLVSEEECIKKEMQLLITRVYGGVLNKETEHFLFYGNNVKEYIDALSNVLEADYIRIVTDLEYQPTGKVMVYLHSSIQRLHSALGVLNGPSWLRAGCTWGILHIAPSEYFSELSAEQIAVHVLAEIIIQKINNLAPYWLHQGIAVYESGWLDKDWLKAFLSEKIAGNMIPSLTELSSDSRAYGDAYGYVYSYSAVEFIVEKYGFAKLRMLLRSPKSFQEIFQCTENQFWDDWQEYLKEKFQ